MCGTPVLCGQMYPHRQHLYHITFASIFGRLHETGQLETEFLSWTSTRCKYTTLEWIAELDPQLFLGLMTCLFGPSWTSCGMRIYTCIYKLVQWITLSVYCFVGGFSNIKSWNVTVALILFTDQVSLDMEGLTSVHNASIYTYNNSHCIHPCRS